MASEENPERKQQLGEEASQLQQDREKSARNAAHVTDGMVLQVSHLRAFTYSCTCAPPRTSTPPHLRR